MGCCNEKRIGWAAMESAPSISLQARLPQPPASEVLLEQSVGFEYVGETALTVLGPITGIHYRFRAPGARLEVDHRDAPYLACVPNLQRLARQVR